MDLRGEPDEVLLSYAAAESLVVVSHDVNTMIAAAHARLAAGLELAGLVLVGQRSDGRAVAHDLVLIGNVSDADEWTGRIDFLPWPRP
ncbi:MAG: hypothetical protein WED34_13105 [Planctomycetales bacterium]